MDREELIGLLSEKGLKITRSRVAVLLSFGSGQKALTYHQISEHMQIKVDRVSLYRILDAFTRKKLVLRINDEEGTGVYILNIYRDVNEQIIPMVRCSGCNKISLLPQLPTSYLSILRENHLNTQPVFNGLCEKCHHD
jgi:Fe2+ or Zn2+ uptake regulation protein